MKDPEQLKKSRELAVKLLNILTYAFPPAFFVLLFLITWNFFLSIIPAVAIFVGNLFAMQVLKKNFEEKEKREQS